MSTVDALARLILAYIDPGAGSLIFQAIVGGMMAVGLAVRIYWRKLRNLFRRQTR